MLSSRRGGTRGSLRWGGSRRGEAEQADAASEHIAAAGADVEPQPFRPVLRGMPLTGCESISLADGVEMQRSEIDTDSVRRLAALRPEGGLVLTVYLSLDPSDTLGARRSRLASLLGEVERSYLAGAELSHEEAAALRSDVARVRDHFERDGGLRSRSARASVVFAASGAGLFEAHRLPRRVESQAVVDASPFIEPLIEAIRPDGWAMLLVSRRTARVLRGNPEVLVEVRRLEDDVHRWHSQGGWSQARFQRGIEKEVHDHVKKAAAGLFTLHRRSPIDHVVIGGPSEVASEAEAALHPYLTARLAGRIEIDVERSAADEVLRAAVPLIAAVERGREREALDRLSEAVGTGGPGSAGLDDVLGALGERRVEMLLVEEGFRAPGVACPSCGRLAATDSTCPLDGTGMERRTDVIEDAFETALAQGAEIVVVRHHSDLAGRGSIAALLRY